MRPRNKIPIESFGPELMAALLHGSTKEFRFDLPYNDAVKFRRRIHQLRVRMREDAHQSAKLVERARVQIVWGRDCKPPQPDPELRRTDAGHRVPVDLTTPAQVVIRPYDVEFGAALKAAGVDIDVNIGSDLKLPDGESYDPLRDFKPTEQT